MPKNIPFRPYVQLMVYYVLSNVSDTNRVVLACQIAMESCMFGFNELESLLVNREDEKFHVQMEGLAPELTTKHRNLRGKDYFNSKNIEKNDK